MNAGQAGTAKLQAVKARPGGNHQDVVIDHPLVGQGLVARISVSTLRTCWRGENRWPARQGRPAGEAGIFAPATRLSAPAWKVADAGRADALRRPAARPCRQSRPGVKTFPPVSRPGRPRRSPLAGSSFFPISACACLRRLSTHKKTVKTVYFIALDALYFRSTLQGSRCEFPAQENGAGAGRRLQPRYRRGHRCRPARCRRAGWRLPRAMMHGWQPPPRAWTWRTAPVTPLMRPVWQRCLTALLAEHGGLDIAVFAAGVNHFAPIAKLDPAAPARSCRPS